MAQVWVALVPIWHEFVLAFNTGDVVPDSVEAVWNYSGRGLVGRAEVDADGPRVEDTGVAFRRDVVLREHLHIGTAPPEAPAKGTVWIDTSV